MKATCAQTLTKGIWFNKKTYTPEPLPNFDESRSKLPSPIFDSRPDWINCYWKAWQLAFDHFRQPMSGSPFVSNYIDEAFNDGLFLWDTSFMTMFCNYCHNVFKGINSLDNFYCTQLPDGQLVREILEGTGEPRAGKSDPGTPDALNHPIPAWAERESYAITGDTARLSEVWEPLVHYFECYDLIKEPNTGLYKVIWAEMDNSPRNTDNLCGIDITAEVGSLARDLAAIAEVLGKTSDVELYTNKAAAITELINKYMWNENDGFYYDWLFVDKASRGVKTIAAYWTLLGGHASDAQAAALVEKLHDSAWFNRTHRVPTVPACQNGYNSATGGYWQGAIWAPTNMMVVRGVERYGYDDLARDIALNHVGNVVKVFLNTGTIWENYAPDSVSKGLATGDFVGWSGLGPLLMLIEQCIGVKVSAPENTVYWRINELGRHGVENLSFGHKTSLGINTVSLYCEARSDASDSCILTVKASPACTLSAIINGCTSLFQVAPGDNSFTAHCTTRNDDDLADVRSRTVCSANL